jgi:hypothetical protein
MCTNDGISVLANARVIFQVASSIRNQPLRRQVRAHCYQLLSISIIVLAKNFIATEAKRLN